MNHRSESRKAEPDGIGYYEYLEKFGVDLSLDRIRHLLRWLGDQHLDYRTVLIGGTNGKGSVSAMLAEILGRAGYRCGLYLSPHVFCLNERVSINGENIPLEDMDSLFLDIRDASRKGEIEITQFEALTTLALLHFREKNVDIAVLEVGLGGRFDATNAAEPELSVITNVSLDHTDLLGSTVENIAFEKMGILRDNRPSIIGQEPDAPGYEYLLRESETRTERTIALGRDFRTVIEEDTGHWTRFDIELHGDGTDSAFGFRKITGLRVNGPWYQAHNASLAVLGAALLMREDGITLPGELVRESISDFSLTARFQIVHEEPMIILDCAHNPDGMERLISSVLRIWTEREKIRAAREPHSPGKINWLCAFMANKDIPAMLTPIYEAATNVYISQLPMERSARVPELAEMAGTAFDDVQKEMRRHGEKSRKRIKQFGVFSDTDLAVDGALMATTRKDILVVAGSIYSLAHFTERLKFHLPELSLLEH